jgi:hypothetical protein
VNGRVAGLDHFKDAQQLPRVVISGCYAHDFVSVPVRLWTGSGVRCADHADRSAPDRSAQRTLRSSTINRSSSDHSYYENVTVPTAYCHDETPILGQTGARPQALHLGLRARQIRRP